MEIRFGLDQLPADPSQDLIVAECEGIVDRGLDGVVGVAARRGEACD